MNDYLQTSIRRHGHGDILDIDSERLNQSQVLNNFTSEYNPSPDVKGARVSHQYMSSARKTKKSTINHIDSDGARV